MPGTNPILPEIPQSEARLNILQYLGAIPFLYPKSGNKRNRRGERQGELRGGYK